LVGGHAPISTLDGYNQNLPGGFAPNYRDPSFEVYDPPYLHWGIAQPQIGAGTSKHVGYGGTLRIATTDAASIASVVLMRNTALTHVVDSDQRSVDLKIVDRDANSVTVATPPNGAVAPPGPYELFINKQTSRGLLPSVAQQEFVG
jgi:hypothetical protein